jgi:hypothetical protein
MVRRVRQAWRGRSGRPWLALWPWCHASEAEPVSGMVADQMVDSELRELGASGGYTGGPTWSVVLFVIIIAGAIFYNG